MVCSATWPVIPHRARSKHPGADPLRMELAAACRGAFMYCSAPGLDGARVRSTWSIINRGAIDVNYLNPLSEGLSDVADSFLAGLSDRCTRSRPNLFGCATSGAHRVLLVHEPSALTPVSTTPAERPRTDPALNTWPPPPRGGQRVGNAAYCQSAFHPKVAELLVIARTFWWTPRTARSADAVELCRPARA